MHSKTISFDIIQQDIDKSFALCDNDGEGADLYITCVLAVALTRHFKKPIRVGVIGVYCLDQIVGDLWTDAIKYREQFDNIVHYKGVRDTVQPAVLTMEIRNTEFI